VESILAHELDRWRRWWLRRSERNGTIGSPPERTDLVRARAASDLVAVEA